ncbi:MAG: AmmeMemoRadiSam system protein B [Candidatus Omnitrophica bacterium]|nr:AmmeMemoRadiSam system protein B [Candidatus Omnitrophota bacterium]
MVRQPAVAGQFYPGNRQALVEQMQKLISGSVNKKDVVGAMVPHAGYMYSGRVAGEVYSRLTSSETYVVISPNHTGYGSRFAVSSESWNTPIGEVEVDAELVDLVRKNTDLVEDDPEAHVYEHSVEVQIPFIQTVAPKAKILPLTVQRAGIEQLCEVSGALSTSVKDLQRDVTVIASSDMTHYESRRSASEKDKLAIQKILDLDPEGLIEMVEARNISMCGYVPVAMMLMYSKDMDAGESELIRYTDSGEVTGDTEQVVGYAGIIIF